MTIKAKLTYTIKPTHPDFQYLTESWLPEKRFTDEDTWHINPDCFYEEEDIEDYIKENMLLTAGGGYDWNGIDNIEFEMKEVNQYA